MNGMRQRRQTGETIWRKLVGRRYEKKLLWFFAHLYGVTMMKEQKTEMESPEEALWDISFLERRSYMTQALLIWKDELAGGYIKFEFRKIWSFHTGKLRHF